jgi:hypothetical protein
MGKGVRLQEKYKKKERATRKGVNKKRGQATRKKGKGKGKRGQAESAD